jgi:hypothetical protein
MELPTLTPEQQQRMNTLAEDNFWGLEAEDIAFIEHGEYNFFEGGHWVWSKLTDNEYEAVYDGLYMHVYKSLEDMMKRFEADGTDLAIENYEYSGELSEENGEETFADDNGKIREYK